MIRPRPTNVAGSIQSRLLALSKQRGEEFNFVLVRYGLERLLYRLAGSRHEGEFIRQRFVSQRAGLA